jgi:hypothetical protein
MKHDAALAQLGSREVELARIAARGRRRSLAIMLITCVPIPFVVGWINDDMSLVAMIPFVSLVGGISYSWSKWTRRPEDSQSVAFAGLSRDQRGIAYRSLISGRAIQDPVVLTIVDSMHQHVVRTGWSAILAASGLAVAAIGLMSVGGAGTWPVIAVVIVGIVAAIGAGWLLTRRAGQVLLRSASAS